MNRSALCLAALLAWPTMAQARDGATRATTRTTDMRGYLEELEHRGLVDRTTGTPEKLQLELRRADEELTSGRPLDAARRLYAVVEGPRFEDLSESDDFQDAEYRLASALARGGSTVTARAYFERSLQRGKAAPMYEAALRGYVDLCLDEKIAPACVATLDQLKVEDVSEDIGYLRGRAAFDTGHDDVAEQELARVSPRSRFYSSALYLRGVLRVRQSDWKAAQDAFCTIANVKDGDPIRFYIDGRYYQLRDLARLALARVAHEQGRYDDAFYHYFLIPSDSKKLPEALFEAAWSSLQRKDYDLGARLVEEFLKTFPDSSRVAEARVLYGTLLVKTCRFAKAEEVFGAVLAEYEPLAHEIDRLVDDAAGRRALAVKLLERARRQAEALAAEAERASEQTPGSKPLAPKPTAVPVDPRLGPRQTETVIAELLDLDPRFYRVEKLAKGLDNGAADGGHVAEVWRELGATLDRTPIASAATRVDAPELLERTVRLGSDVAAAREEAERLPSAERNEQDRALSALEKRRGELESALGHLLDVSPDDNTTQARGLSALIAADARRANELAGRSAALRGRLEGASSELLREALLALRGRIDDSLRSARLGKIDSVVGQKRRLEREIEDLAKGRFPPELFGKLHLEGLIKDDEIYWPPERELWLDEYDDYK
ncbi:MAG: tetratricopeptide repeat protein [Polyangia bacterium]